jgi:3-hydroxyisobutyrate dehydrogenase-like beta-hydroxyacid dehydrogenase
MAILKSIKKDTKTLSFRMPAEVVRDLEAAKAEAKEAGFTLDLTEQVERLVTASIKQARAELAGSGVGPAAEG